MNAAPPGSRIALTGATGFVGRHVLDQLLEAGYRLSALTRRDPFRTHEDIDWVRGDLGDPVALRALVRNTAGVVHLAGAIKGRRRQDFFDANVRGTFLLMNALREEGLAETSRVVHISSLAAREPGLSHYAASKAEAEKTLRDLRPALDWTILRAPAVYGPGDEETLFFFKTAQARLPVLPGRSANRTSLIHVHDFARAIMTALQTPELTGKTIDVHDDAPKGYTLEDVISYIGGGEPLRALFLPGFVLQLAGAINLGISTLLNRTPSLTPGKARELTHSDWVCTDRTLIEETSWRPWIKAERGLVETRDWYRLHGYLE